MSSSYSYPLGENHSRRSGHRPLRLLRAANDNVKDSGHQTKTLPTHSDVEFEQIKGIEVGSIAAMIDLLAFAAYVELSAHGSDRLYGD